MEDIKKLDGEVFVGAKTFEVDYSDRYLISNMGRCYNLKRKKFIGSWNKGYLYVYIHDTPSNKRFMIGRLMLMSFDVPIPEHLKNLPLRKVQCSHIDEDSTHNYLWNLCWESPKENSSRQLRRQRCSESQKGKHMSEETRQKMSKSHKGKYIGKMNHNSKPVLQYTKDGELIREWNSMMDVQRELGICNQNIYACCKGKLKSAGGYIWRYA